MQNDATCSEEKKGTLDPKQMQWLHLATDLCFLMVNPWDLAHKTLPAAGRPAGGA